MSIRLNIVLTQASGASPKDRDVEGELVAGLIGAPGMDLSLIGPLASLDPQSTDRLVLDGIQGDVAVLCWCPAEQAVEVLGTAGIPGRRAPHSLDPEAPGEHAGQTQRRVYLFDMRELSSAAAIQGLQRLLAARRTMTYSLSPPAPAESAQAGSLATSATKRSPTLTESAQVGSLATSATKRSPAPADSPQLGSLATSATKSPPPAPSEPQQADEWDALVDDLEAWDG